MPLARRARKGYRTIARSMIIEKTARLYEKPMQGHRFLLFPAGAPGIGLLLLRTSILLFLFSFSGDLATTSAPALAVDLLALFIVGGFCTRAAACISAGIALFALLGASAPASLSLLAHAIDAVIIALVGPGAFAIDARIFGRRTINLPSQ